MIGSFEKNSLNELLKDFYTVVGIRISVFDDSFNLVTEYPSSPPEICAAIRATEKGYAACVKCDSDACKRAKKLHGAHTYVCHAGITEAITPIQLDGGVVGYAILAHLMPAENYEETLQEICRRCTAYGLDEERVKTDVRKLKKYSAQKISAAMRLLDAVASFLQISKMATWKNENIAAQINRFIEQNLDGDLQSEVLCKHFFLSRTKLYQLSMHAFGMGIAQYVTFKRIEKAKELLKSGETAIADVAFRVGIDDYNYFCKLFRKQVGVPPGKYKKQ